MVDVQLGEIIERVKDNEEPTEGQNNPKVK